MSNNRVIKYTNPSASFNLTRYNIHNNVRNNLSQSFTDEVGAIVLGKDKSARKIDDRYALIQKKLGSFSGRTYVDETEKENAIKEISYLSDALDITLFRGKGATTKYATSIAAIKSQISELNRSLGVGPSQLEQATTSPINTIQASPASYTTLEESTLPSSAFEEGRGHELPINLTFQTTEETAQPTNYASNSSALPLESFDMPALYTWAMTGGNGPATSKPNKGFRRGFLESRLTGRSIRAMSKSSTEIDNELKRNRGTINATFDEKVMNYVGSFVGALSRFSFKRATVGAAAAIMFGSIALTSYLSSKTHASEEESTPSTYKPSPNSLPLKDAETKKNLETRLSYSK